MPQKSINYRTSLYGIDPSMLAGFFEGWTDHPSPAMHLQILRGSNHVVLAINHDSKRVIGFINAVSDGMFSAAVPLLEVLPAFRGQGIGSELVRRMLCALDGYYSVDLVCDADLQGFYEKQGLQRGVAMLLRNYVRQAGCAVCTPEADIRWRDDS